MEIYILFAVVVFGLVVAGAGMVLIIQMRAAGTSQDSSTIGKYPQGYWMGVGIAIGLLIGYGAALFIGVLTDSVRSLIVFGPGFGCVIGVAIGAALEQRHKNDIRPLTAQEQKVRKWAALGGVVLVLVGLIAFVAVLLVAGLWG